MTATGAVVVIAAATLLGASSASAVDRAPARGHFSYAWQSTVTHDIHVHGYALDRHHPHRRITVGLFVHGRLKKKVRANDRTPNATTMGRHGFSTVVHLRHSAHRIRLAVYENGHRQTNRHARVLGHRTPTGEKIVSVARHHLDAQYSYGAAGPNAFDCSGYTRYVFAHAHVASLPHNSEAQRHTRKMHRIARRHARPGDLVFYMSGGNAYHVSIYAGHGMQYSATDPAQGVEHDRISSRSVIFGTDWH